MIPPARSRLAAALAAALLAAGCGSAPFVSSAAPPAAMDEITVDATSPDRLPAPPEPEPLPPVQLAVPDTGVLYADDGDELALAVAEAFYVTAPYVVLAPASPPGRDVAISTAIELGVPVLPGRHEFPPTGSASSALPMDRPIGTDVAPLLTELGTVATVGTVDPALDVDHLPLSSVARAERSPFGPPDTLPVEVLVLHVPSDLGARLAVATARAAGAETVAVPGGDPRLSSEAIAALAGHDGPVLVIGTDPAFADAGATLRRVGQAQTGVELPGGGQVLFPHRMFVALYGHPGTSSLGVLGEQDIDATIDRAREHASWYDDLVEVPVVPTLEIIATVASASAGADGDYSSEATVESLRPWVDAARDAGVYVVLDLQPGRSDFLSQALRYEPLLLEPHVGLALDPEWRLRPGQVHLRQIGSVGIDEVNRVADWLAGLVARAGLPQKLLVIHQFKHSMIADREHLDTSHDELAVLIHMDGQGGQATKDATYRSLTRTEPPAGVWWGWKNFYDEDHPTMRGPADTMAADPAVWFVSYQ